MSVVELAAVKGQAREGHCFTSFHNGRHAVAFDGNREMPGVLALGTMVEQPQLVAVGHHPHAAVLFVHIIKRDPNGHVGCRFKGHIKVLDFSISRKRLLS